MRRRPFRFLEILTKRNSGAIAKKRLQFLLIADRAGCGPDILQMIRDDMIKVISKYMEIDTAGLEIGMCREKPALYANIPIRALSAKGTYL